MRMRVMVAFVMLGGLALFASMIRIIPAEPPAPVQVAAGAPPAERALAAIAQPQAPVPQSGPVTLREHPLLTVPVQGVERRQITDTWGQSRANGARAHQGTDIMAPGGTPVVAAAAGTVEKLFFSNGGGGITLYVRSSDRLWTYYYAHLAGYAPGLHEGQVVAAGELIGFVGDTGNAGIGNFHLHFGVSRMLPEQRWWEGEPVNPYPLLAGPGTPR